MRIIYVTLNTVDEARLIAQKILAAKLANCVNWFPITCMYNYNNEVSEEPEVVMMVKTTPDRFRAIEEIIKKEINYTNCIAELQVHQVNAEFSQWLYSVVRD